jgi:hypothetical protein
MPSLLEEPIPELVHYVDTNPYDDPANPPSDPVFIFSQLNLSFSVSVSVGKTTFRSGIHFQKIEPIGIGL